MTAAVMDELQRAFERSYLREAPPAWLRSAEGQAEVRREIVDKYELCRRHVIPWVARVAELEGATVLEVGCGTGAKTAAFAQHADYVYGCDLSRLHVEAARSRVEALGLGNVALSVEDAQSFFDRFRGGRSGAADICLLFAVLEHMTLEERLATLRDGWELLRPGGVMVVVETPNRLLPWDWHSSKLPFFNCLPDDLALRYYDRSPREDFVRAVRSGAERSYEDALLALTRQGRGVSNHEFELILGDLADKIVADSWDPEIIEMNPCVRDELELKAFFEREQLDIPIAFTRYSLDLILRKP